MGFFEPPPPPPEPEPHRPLPPWFGAPDDVLPGVVALELVLARNDQAAVAVTRLGAYPTGMEFDVSVRLRAETHGDPFDWQWRTHRRPAGKDLPDEFLRLGVAFADGRKATNLGGGAEPPDEAEPEGPVLHQGGGGGGGRRWDMQHWVWPLPPEGPLTFVVEWPARGIGLTRAEIDARLVRDAAERSVRLWPDDPGGGASRGAHWTMRIGDG